MDALVILILVVAFAGTFIAARPFGWWFFVWVQRKRGNDEAVAWAEEKRK